MDFVERSPETTRNKFDLLPLYAKVLNGKADNIERDLRYVEIPITMDPFL